MRTFKLFVFGKPCETVEVVPLTEELFDRHVKHMTCADPLYKGAHPGPTTFERVFRKGFTEVALMVTPRGTRVFMGMGHAGFVPAFTAGAMELKEVL